MSPIPATFEVLRHPLVAGLALDDGTRRMLVREALNEIRRAPLPTRAEALRVAVARVAGTVAAFRLPRRRYLNATGIVIHTQWGSAPLSPEVRARVEDALGASPTGPRGREERTAVCMQILRTLTGAEAAAITTQNAASCLLVAGALAARREIVCAARDLIEIGHGARLRDILESCGARVVPVGAANCVYLDDYRGALGAETAFVLRIHAANTVTTGYTAHVNTRDLASVAQDAGIPLVVNLGSGSLVDLRDRGLPYAPTLQDALRDGADVVLASGDKLIGGPQAGIVCGREEMIHRLISHPIARCCRPGKLTLASLEATLCVYARGQAWHVVPVLRLLAAPADTLAQRAYALAVRARDAGYELAVRADETECGGATLPGVRFPTWTVRLRSHTATCDDLYETLLAWGVVTRRHEDAVVIDLRSVLPEDDDRLGAAITHATDTCVAVEEVTTAFDSA